MPTQEIARSRPERWDKPFGEGMTDELVDRLMGVPPFSMADEASFPRSTPLRGLLKNDSRVVIYEPDQIVFREGDYGGSAFLVLDGQLRVSLDRLPPAKEQPGIGKQLMRFVASLSGARSVSHGDHGPRKGLFLQDVPVLLDAQWTAHLGPGEVFGELAALTRAPRSGSVSAVGEAALLEIRWQGLRDMMRYSPAFASHIESLYRERTLQQHLHETPLLSRLEPDAIARVAGAITFESYGAFDWRDAPSGDRLDAARREPVIVQQGSPVEEVLFVRNGFVRMTSRLGQDERTISYLGRGRTAGAEEAFVAHARNQPPEWRRSLRAVGYVDLLRLPAETFLKEVAPTLPNEQTDRWFSRADEPSTISAASDSARTLDFLVEQRLMNGLEAMVIDLERCTRCDDCVRACAATHDGEPRFVRQGPTHDHLQFAEACMHCVDPTCLIGCPTGAIHRDEQTGSVRVNDSTCIGCSLCEQGCPYNAIKMVERRSPGGAIVIDEASGQPQLAASKCDLCVEQSSGPACQNACPHDALVRITLADTAPLNQWSQR